MEPKKPWKTAIFSLVPLWLFSLAVSAEGFPQPPIPIWLAIVALVLAIVTSSALTRKRWLTIETILYSLLPFVLLYHFDEIDTSYKTPFILLCALIWSIGIIGYQRSSSYGLKLSILLLVAIAVLVLAARASQGYWQMISDLGYQECFPGTSGCSPLTGEETPWWVLFFGW